MEETQYIQQNPVKKKKKPTYKQKPNYINTKKNPMKGRENRKPIYTQNPVRKIKKSTQ